MGAGFRTVVRFFGQDELAAIRPRGYFFGHGRASEKMGAGISDGRADFSDKTNWQPYDRAVIFSDTGERPKKWVRDFGRSCGFFGQDELAAIRPCGYLYFRK